MSKSKAIKSIRNTLFTGLIFAITSNHLWAAPFAYITNSGDDTVSVIDTATNMVVDTIEVGLHPIGLAWNPDGTRLYIGNNGIDGDNNTVSVIDLTTNKVIDEFVVGPGPEGLSVHPDGKRLYVATPGIHFLPPDCILGDLMTIVDIENDANTVLKTIPVGDHPWGVLADPANDLVYVTNAHSETLTLIDTSSDTIENEYNMGDGCDTDVDNHPVGLARHPDQNILYVGHMHASKLSEFNLISRRITRQVDLSVGDCPDQICKHAHDLVISPDGSTIYASLFFSGEVAVVDTASFMVTDIIHIGGMGPKGIDILPDGSRVYVASQFDDVVYVIDTASKTVIESIVVGRAPIAFGNFIIPSMQTSGPAIDSVRPKRLRKDRSTNVTIVGSNFVDGLSITVSPSDTGITVGRIRLSGSD